MFKKRKQNISVIKTIITKTSDQAQHEKEVERQAFLQARTCPECGHLHSDNRPGIPMKYEGTNTYVIHSDCTQCKTEWRVEYKL